MTNEELAKAIEITITGISILDDFDDTRNILIDHLKTLFKIQKEIATRELPA
jgi:hypothetical protein